MLTTTNNLLLRREWLERLDGPLDRRFDLTGGENTHLLELLFRLGARMGLTVPVAFLLPGELRRDGAALAGSVLRRREAPERNPGEG